MNRTFARIAVGGIRDESEIRGHRRTYVGAMPGRIVSAMRRADCENPLFVIDEAVERIRDRTIVNFIYDPKTARLIERVGQQ